MPNLRTSSLKVNITPEVYERLRALAERQGQAPSVLASVAVGQYVSAHMAPLDTQREMLERAMEMVEKMPQQLLDLDREERRLSQPLPTRRKR